MARAPDPRIEQAKAMCLKGMKLVEIASQLNLPEGTVRSWKNRYKWDCNVAKEKRNVAKRKRAVSQAIKMQPVRRRIRMQLRQESLRLSFLIA